MKIKLINSCKGRGTDLIHSRQIVNTIQMLSFIGLVDICKVLKSEWDVKPFKQIGLFPQQA